MQPHLITFDDPPSKRCTKCGEVKAATLEYFSRHNGTRDGLRPDCKACDRAYRMANREQRNENSRRRYYADLEGNRKRLRELYAIHSEYHRSYRRANKEKIAKRTRLWVERNPERKRELVHKRRNLKLAAEGSHTAEDIQAQLKRQKRKCYYCGKKVGKNYHVDHVVPLSRGGSDDPSNLVIACASCNLSKNDKLPHEWPQGGRLL